MADIGAGALDHRVQFLRAAVSDDGLSGVETFAPHGAPVWASRKDLSDGERWQAGQINADVTTRFVIRGSAFAAGITPKDRLTCRGRTYAISGIKALGRGGLLEITASARADL